MISDTMTDYVLYSGDCVTLASPNALTISQSVEGDYDPQGGFGDRAMKLDITINVDSIVQSNLYSADSNGNANGASTKSIV